MARRPAVHVTDDPDTPMPKDVLATAIARMSESVLKLRKSGLNDKAIIALVKDDTGISKAQIQVTFDSLESLRKKYCH